MIYFISKPGFYRTFSEAAPVYVSPSEVHREECKKLLLQIAPKGVRAKLFTLLANHGAKNLRQVHDDALPVLLAELRAIALVLGVEQ